MSSVSIASRGDDSSSSNVVGTSGTNHLLATSAHDLEQLRAVLLAADAQTQAFLGPLLPLRAVQHVLLSFVRDTTRSFADWVWDPSVRQLLNQLREQNPQAHHHAQDVDRWFDRAVHDQWTAAKQQQTADAADVSEQLLRDADAAQDDGKRKFRARDFYAAKNAFELSLERLAAHVRRDTSSDTVDVHDWSPHLQQRFVTLCTNVAICGIKLHDLSTIRLYANKALAVDPNAPKALYATAKLYVVEHLYDDAYAAVDRALAIEPTNAQLKLLRADIDAMQAREQAEHASLAHVAAQKRDETAREQLVVAQQQESRAAARVTASDFVPLPALDDDKYAAANLHKYFSKVKHELQIQITQLHNPDNSEPPLFACSMTDATTGTALACDIRGASKKLVKNAAAKCAIDALWAAKTAAGTLIEEDVAHLAAVESMANNNTSTSNNNNSTSAELEYEANDPTATASLRTTTSEPASSMPLLPVQLFANERALDTVMLLNQLQQQKRLCVAYDIEDLLPTSKTATEFRCTVRINGQVLGVATAPAKKKARFDAARMAFAAAVAANIVKYNDPEASDYLSEYESEGRERRADE